MATKIIEDTKQKTIDCLKDIIKGLEKEEIFIRCAEIDNDIKNNKISISIDYSFNIENIFKIKG